MRVSTTGGLALLAASPLSSCTAPDPSAAQPWSGPSPELDKEDVRLRILSYGLLAPSFRNLQPWWADVKRDGIVVLPERNRIPTLLDPATRQTTISFGCFLETLAIASASYGFTMGTELFPDGVDDLLAAPTPRTAVCSLTPGSGDLGIPVEAVLRRRTNRAPFDGRPVSNQHRDALNALTLPEGIRFVIIEEPGTVEAMSRAIRSEETDLLSDSDRLDMYMSHLRVTADELKRGRDGIMLENTGMSGVDRAWFRLLSGVGSVDKRAMIDGLMSALQEQTGSTASYGLLVSDGDSQADRIGVGRALMRVSLKATQLGIAHQPFSRVVETEKGQASLAELITTDARRVQAVFRLGYASEVPPSPRRSLFEVVRI